MSITKITADQIATATITTALMSTGYIGQQSITTLGTVATGAWQATKIGVGYGGTGLSTFAQGDILYASSLDVIAGLTKNASASRYLSNTGLSNNPAWAQVNLTNGVTGTLPVSNGGTGLSTITSSGLLIGNGTNAVSVLSPGSNGQALYMIGNAPTWSSITKVSSSGMYPTATTSTTGVMAGLGKTLIPVYSGRVLIIVTGQAQNNTGDSGFKYDLRYGTNPIPSNAVPVTGTIVGSAISGSCIASSSTTGLPVMPIAHHAIVTGLSLGVSYWFDIGIYAVTSGTATFNAVSLSVLEI